MISVHFIVGARPKDITGNLVCPAGYGIPIQTEKAPSSSESNDGKGRFTRPDVRSGSRLAHGVTLVELLAVVAMVAALSAIAIPTYQGYIDDVRLNDARKDITLISVHLERFRSDNRGSLPGSLAQTPASLLEDPWGNPYRYLNIEDATGPGLGKLRKDKNLVPLNTDFDLYSMGEDGDSKGPLTAKASRDDVVRANNGGYIGLASEY
jgi:general secretion pathway protein G